MPLPFFYIEYKNPLPDPTGEKSLLFVSAGWIAHIVRTAEDILWRICPHTGRKHQSTACITKSLL